MPTARRLLLQPLINLHRFHVAFIHLEIDCAARGTFANLHRVTGNSKYLAIVRTPILRYQLYPGTNLATQKVEIRILEGKLRRRPSHRFFRLNIVVGRLRSAAWRDARASPVRATAAAGGGGN